MIQSKIMSCIGSIDLAVAESLSKVSISQIGQVQEDSSTLLPSLVQIVFKSSCSHEMDAVVEYEEVRTRTNEKVIDCRQDSRKRMCLSNTQEKMALSIDDDLVENQSSFQELDLLAMSALPMRTLMMTKSMIKSYADQQRLIITSQEMKRKILLFSCLLLAALQLKTLNIEELQGQVQKSIFGFQQKQIMKYIANLIEDISKAIELSKQNKEDIWSKLEQKIKYHQNKYFRRKFLSINIQQQNPSILQKQEKTSTIQNFTSQILSSENRQQNKSQDGIINFCIDRFDQNESGCQLDNKAFTHAINTYPMKEDLKQLQKLCEKDETNGLVFSQANQKFDYVAQAHLQEKILSLSANKSIFNRSQYDFIGKNTQTDLNQSIRAISDTTQGYLTQIQISFDEMISRKEDCQLFKNSCNSDFQDGELIIFQGGDAIINASCNI